MSKIDASEHQNTSEDVAGVDVYEARQNSSKKPQQSGSIEARLPLTVSIEAKTALFLACCAFSVALPSSDAWLGVAKVASVALVLWLAVFWDRDSK